ncbi:MAG TPA: SRPBCC family protein [Acidimicrobiales bacterium]|nr:SRPBCC family protein [Acidimicrobiales bacterium]
MTELRDELSSPPATTFEHLQPLLAASAVRNVLRTNAVVSASTGLLAALAGGPLAGLLDVPSVAVRGIGVGLVAFSAGLVAAAGVRHRRLPGLTRAIAAADVTWVVASAGLIAAGVFSLAGSVVVGAAGLVVGAFALLEVRGARRVLEAGPGPEVSPPLEAIRVAAEADVAPARAWEIITDHDLYGRLAPSLSSVEVTSGDGPGLTRRCVNTKGQAWSETCTLWDEGRAYAVDVDTSAYPYPLAVMRGRWSVEPAGAGRTRFGMDFVFQPRPTIVGRGFAWAMQLAFPRILRRILRGWVTHR